MSSQIQKSQIDKTAQQKNYEQFGKEINNSLKQFEKTREWADIGNWLMNLHPILLNKRFGNIPHKIRLAKRLAQCLNPSLPVGVHGNALNIYHIILNNFGNKIQMLPLLSIGLFPFFEYCSTQLKYELLQIFNVYYIKSPECLQLVTSLVNTLLTGFIQNNQTLNKKIYALLDQIAQLYGRVWIDGAVWVNILKSPKVRGAGYKYFMKSFKDRDDAQNPQNNQQKNQNEKEQTQNNNNEDNKKGENKQNQQKPLDKSQVLHPSQPREQASSNNKEKQLQFKEQQTKIGQQSDKKKNKQQEQGQQSKKQEKRRKISTDSNKDEKKSKSDQTQQNQSQDDDIHEQSEAQKQQKQRIIRVNSKNSKQNKLGKGLTIQSAASLTSDMLLDQASHQLRDRMLQSKQQQDGFNVRFPNFSSLVVNAICQSLESPFSDNVVRRATLDLMINYLNLDQTDMIEQKDFIVLMNSMLHMINLKQYSLTRRIYTFLFGPPSIQGIYKIQPQKKPYNFHILKVSLEKLLKIQVKENYPSDIYLGTINIIQIMLEDNKQLQQILLPTLSYKILKYLRIAKMSQQRLDDFYTQVLEPNSNIFIQGIQTRIFSQQVQKSPAEARQTIHTIQYFYSLKKAMKQLGKQNISFDYIPKIIQYWLAYVLKIKFSYERLTCQILDLCLKLGSFVPKNESINQNSIQILNKLIQNRPSNNIYVKLLSLHPMPPKQDMMPFINDASLSIISIRNLLNLNKEEFSQIERKQLLFAIFKLFQCRIWQDKALQFIKSYKQKFPQELSNFINEVEPAQWLIYWDKVNGDVEGGTIRILKILEEDHDKNYRQQIKKWLQDSSNMPNKIIAPIYQLMAKTESKNMELIYRMLKRVFKAQKSQVSHYFFDQRQRLLLPLINRIFQCIQSGDQALKIASVEMLQFLLQKTITLDEKLVFLSITFNKTLRNLKQSQGKQQEAGKQIQTIQYFMSMADSFRYFEGNSQKRMILQQIIEGEQYFLVMAEGMKKTKNPYIRTLYIQVIQRTLSIFIKIYAQSAFISKSVQQITPIIFEMLKQNDVSSLQHIISGTEASNRKLSDDVLMEEERKVTKSEFNVQKKYAQVIQLWNFIRFIFEICIQHGIHQIPSLQLLTFILQSFPFAMLKYEQISSRFLMEGYQQMQEEINSVTGLKKQVLSIFSTLWTNYQTNITDFLIDKGDPRILIHGGIDPVAVLNTLCKCQGIKKIQSYYGNDRIKMPKKVLHYSQQMLVLENKICYFVYLYLAYCNLQKITGNFKQFATLFINFSKVLNMSQHSQTKLWLFELLYCLSEKINLKNMIYDNNKIKNDIYSISNALVDQITSVSSKSKLFTKKSQVKSGWLTKVNKEQLQEEEPKVKFDFVKPWPPTISKLQYLYQNSMKNFVNQNIRHIQDQTKIYIFNQSTDLSLDQFISYISAVCIKTYTSLLVPLLTNLYDNDAHKIEAICKQNVQVMLKSGASKTQSDKMYMETVAELIRKLITYSSIRTQLIKDLRKNIIQVYMRDDFFKCTKNALDYWKPIIDCCTQNYDLMPQLLSKEGLFESLFSRKTVATQIQIKNFERVCFLILSGRIDKYQHKLRVVLESLSKVMKSQNPSPALLILILFCLRILFMRLSEGTLTKIFRTIWPSLITLLIQIFTKKKYENCINLHLAGLKMLELVHALQLEQFNIHKWIFIFDYFGLKIEHQTQSQRAMTESVNILTPFKFKPILTRILPNEAFKCTFKPQELPANQINENGRRRLIITQTAIQSKQQLKKSALELLQYMIDSNHKRVTTTREQIQDIIEQDFISLDDYIYNVK